MIFYGPEEAPEAKELGQKSPKSTTRVEGAPAPLGHASLPCHHLVDPPDLFPMPKIPIKIETTRNKPRPGVPPPQASVATKNQSGAHSGTLTEGETITDDHLHHPGALHDVDGVVHPRG